MNYLEYIDSKDIREYLMSINYSVSSVEAAWLIYKSLKSIRVKHKGYQSIIEEMPDMAIDVEGYLDFKDDKATHIHFDSLHEFLKMYMEIEAMLEKTIFSGGNGSIYIYDLDNAYKSMEECIAKTMEHDYSVVGFPPHGIRLLSQTDEIEYIDFSIKNGRLDRILEVAFQSDKSELKRIYSTFFLMGLDLPVPFKKGDIVMLPDRNYGKSNAQPRVFLGKKTLCNHTSANVLAILNLRKRDGVRDLCDHLEEYIYYEYPDDKTMAEARDMEFMRSVSYYIRCGSINSLLNDYKKWFLKEVIPDCHNCSDANHIYRKTVGYPKTAGCPPKGQPNFEWNETVPPLDDSELPF